MVVGSLVGFELHHRILLRDLGTFSEVFVVTKTSYFSLEAFFSVIMLIKTGILSQTILFP